MDISNDSDKDTIYQVEREPRPPIDRPKNLVKTGSILKKSGPKRIELPPGKYVVTFLGEENQILATSGGKHNCKLILKKKREEGYYVFFDGYHTPS